MKKLTKLLFLLAILLGHQAISQVISYQNTWAEPGITIKSQNATDVKLNFSISEFAIGDLNYNKEIFKTVHLPGVYLPNNEGAPNLPGLSEYIAIPQGATAQLKIVDYELETYENILIGPAPRIPIDSYNEPLTYPTDKKTYSEDKFYPESPFHLSQPSQLRGIDFVTFGVTPFQYNPITKTLKVYRNVKFEVNFEGGNGKFVLISTEKPTLMSKKVTGKLVAFDATSGDKLYENNL